MSLFAQYSEKSLALIFTEKIYYEKIINQLMDLFIYKFFQVITNKGRINKSSFLETVIRKNKELRNWLKLKASELNSILRKGSLNLEEVFQANRRDSFSFGAARKGTSIFQISLILCTLLSNDYWYQLLNCNLIAIIKL